MSLSPPWATSSFMSRRIWPIKENSHRKLVGHIGPKLWPDCKRFTFRSQPAASKAVISTSSCFALHRAQNALELKPFPPSFIDSLYSDQNIKPPLRLVSPQRWLNASETKIVSLCLPELMKKYEKQNFLATAVVNAKIRKWEGTHADRNIKCEWLYTWEGTYTVQEVARLLPEVCRDRRQLNHDPNGDER